MVSTDNMSPTHKVIKDIDYYYLYVEIVVNVFDVLMYLY